MIERDLHADRTNVDPNKMANFKLHDAARSSLQLHIKVGTWRLAN